MPRYIDLDKVDEHINSYCNTTSVTHCNRDCAECFYNNGGAEDVAPVVHAEWFEKKSMIYCSNCASSWEAGYINDFKYCPHCGAKMDKEDK